MGSSRTSALASSASWEGLRRKSKSKRTGDSIRKAACVRRPYIMLFHSVSFRFRQCLSALVLIPFGWTGLFAQMGGFLKISAVDGEGSFNDMKHKLSHPPVVRVVDESNNFVQGAEVSFILPVVGPSGVFGIGGNKGTTITDEKGIARCPIYLPNSEEGRFNIKVTAESRGKTGTIVLSQSNTLAGGSSVGARKKSKL